MARIPAQTGKWMVRVLLVTVLLTACSDNPGMVLPQEEETAEIQKEVESTATLPQADHVLMGTMTLEEKAGQVLMLSFRWNGAGNPLEVLDEDTAAAIASLMPGGVILFSQNVVSESQVRSLIDDLQRTSPIPLFVAVDEEGGSVRRLGDKLPHFPQVPSAAHLASTADAAEIRETGRVVGEALRELGFTMNMAPVADVDSNPVNPVIGRRSFGSDPNQVAELATAMGKGLEAGGVIPVLKHFPGHGDSQTDSHLEEVWIHHSLDRLSQVELVPFQRGIDEDLPAIMTGHLHIPVLDQNLPATLSHGILTDLLRGTMGFEGLVITDALDMAAITTNCQPEEAAVLALMAGADMLLMPQDPIRARDGIVAAVQDGTIPLERLEEAVGRVLALKYRGNLLPE